MSYILEVDHEDGQCTSSKPRVRKLLSRVERGEEILITKRSKPVALLCPYQQPRLIQGLPWGAAVRAFTRDEMHER
jgi:prevent-host-death family protein